jgi:transcription antitermination factor NusG
MPEKPHNDAFADTSGPERWYALRVRSRCEKAVQRALLARGYDHFLPLHRRTSKWSDREREVQFPLFPGYIFSRFDFARRVPILCIPGVIHIVGNGNIPIAIKEHELKAIARFLDSGLPLTPWPYLQIGQAVVVRHGSLAGVEGILLKLKGRTRLVVSVALLQRSVAVEIERDWVTPMGSAPDARSFTDSHVALCRKAHGYLL